MFVGFDCYCLICLPTFGVGGIHGNLSVLLDTIACDAMLCSGKVDHDTNEGWDACCSHHHTPMPSK